MPMSVDDLRAHLTEAFPDAEIVIDDLAAVLRVLERKLIRLV